MPNIGHKLRLGYSPGRQAGKANILSQTVRSGLLATYHRVGGIDGMVKWVEESSENRGQFYGYLTKLLPAELAESGAGGSIKVIVYGKPDQQPIVLASSESSTPALEAQEGEIGPKHQ